MTIRVLIVDDHPVALGGMEASLAAHADFLVAGRAGSVAEARQMLDQEPVDVVLADLRLSDGLATELLVAADGEPSQGPPLVILSNYYTPQHVQIAIRMGAYGFLRKTAPIAEIVAAVRRAAEGAVLFTPAQLRRGFADDASLTPRERQVLAGVVAGRTNDELSGDLSIAKKTVEGYLRRLFERFEVASRTELAVKAEREDLLDLPVRDRRQRHQPPNRG